jgi:hypothetical protein
VPASTALKVRQTLEAAGVEFTNEGQPGGETEVGPQPVIRHIGPSESGVHEPGAFIADAVAAFPPNDWHPAEKSLAFH